MNTHVDARLLHTQICADPCCHVNNCWLFWGLNMDLCHFMQVPELLRRWVAGSPTTTEGHWQTNFAAGAAADGQMLTGTHRRFIDAKMVRLLPAMAPLHLRLQETQDMLGFQANALAATPNCIVFANNATQYIMKLTSFVAGWPQYCLVELYGDLSLWGMRMAASIARAFVKLNARHERWH